MKAIFGILLIMGCVYGIVFGYVFIAINTKGKTGRDLRYCLYQMVEKGRRRE